MNYELYRRSTLGLALTDALDELVQNQQLTPNLGLKVMGQFDKVMTESLNNKVKVRANLKVIFKCFCIFAYLILNFYLGAFAHISIL